MTESDKSVFLKKEKKNRLVAAFSPNHWPNSLVVLGPSDHPSHLRKCLIYLFRMEAAGYS